MFRYNDILKYCARVAKPGKSYFCEESSRLSLTDIKVYGTESSAETGFKITVIIGQNAQLFIPTWLNE